MDPQRSIITLCQDVYAQAKRLPILADPSIGFEVLLTPPRYRPPILFVGYQPGNGAKDMSVQKARDCGYEDWPQRNDLLCGNSRLAYWLQTMFGRERLSECVAMNAIFIRWRSVAEYQRAVPRKSRKEIERFCLGKVEAMVAAMKPERIVVIGFSTLDHLGSRTDRGAGGRKLTIEGQVFGRKVLATQHLSGARISNEERRSIAKRVLDFSSD